MPDGGEDWGEDDEGEGVAVQAGDEVVIAVAEDDVVEDDGEAGVEEGAGEQGHVGEAEAELAFGFAVGRAGLIDPVGAGDDHALERVGFDVDAAGEAFGEQAGDG